MQEDIRKLREDVDNGAVKRDAGVARIAGMQKELRGTIAQIEQFTSSRDRKGLLMAGADRAIRELMVIFKDDPIEIPLEEASMSIWAKMQYEESEYPDRRIQTHKPTSGKIKINQATNKLNTFIELAFSKESTYNQHQQEAKPFKWNCQ